MKIRKVINNLEECFYCPLDLRAVNNPWIIWSVHINCRCRGNNSPHNCFAASFLNQRAPKPDTWNLAQYSTIQYNTIIGPFQQKRYQSSLRTNTHDTWILVKLTYFGWPQLPSNTKGVRRLSLLFTYLNNIFSSIFSRSKAAEKGTFGKLTARKYSLTNLLGLVCLTALTFDGCAEPTHNL